MHTTSVGAMHNPTLGETPCTCSDFLLFNEYFTLSMFGFVEIKMYTYTNTTVRALQEAFYQSEQ